MFRNKLILNNNNRFKIKQLYKIKILTNSLYMINNNNLTNSKNKNFINYVDFLQII